MKRTWTRLPVIYKFPGQIGSRLCPITFFTLSISIGAISTLPGTLWCFSELLFLTSLNWRIWLICFHSCLANSSSYPLCASSSRQDASPIPLAPHNPRQWSSNQILFWTPEFNGFRWNWNVADSVDFIQKHSHKFVFVNILLPLWRLIGLSSLIWV